MMKFEGCPGSGTQDFKDKEEVNREVTGSIQSQLKQWPIQLHLINPSAPYYDGADVLLAADCTAFSMGNFHNDYLKGKSIAISCPKLDQGQDIYEEKIKSWFEDARINTLTIMIMQVPCCGGLTAIVKSALEKSSRKVPVKQIVVGIQGEILSEEWV